MVTATKTLDPLTNGSLALDILANGSFDQCAELNALALNHLRGIRDACPSFIQAEAKRISSSDCATFGDYLRHDCEGWWNLCLPRGISDSDKLATWIVISTSPR